MSECVVTDTVARLMTQEKLTGFRLRDAFIVTSGRSIMKNANSLPKVWELEVQGKGGDADPESGIRLLHVCPECGYTAYSSFQRGIIVDESQWDRTDLFTVNGYRRHIIITERVKGMLEDPKSVDASGIREDEEIQREVDRLVYTYPAEDEIGRIARNYADYYDTIKKLIHAARSYLESLNR